MRGEKLKRPHVNKRSVVSAFVALARAERINESLQKSVADAKWLAKQPGAVGVAGTELAENLVEAHWTLWHTLEVLRPDKKPEQHWLKKKPKQED